MKEQSKENCCKGCHNGKPGSNPPCKAKLMAAKSLSAKSEEFLDEKTLNTKEHEN